MDLKQLRHFVAIIDEGSFSNAARAIPISQPALTRSLQNLEASLGIELIERTTRGLLMTGAGETLYRHAKLILTETDKAKTAVKSDSNAPQDINIGIAPLFASAIIPQAISALGASYPDHVVTVTSGLFPALVEKVATGRLDAVFSNLPFTDLPDSLTVEPLFDISVNYICSASHPLAKQNTVSFAEMTDYPWAVVDEDNANELYRYIFTSEGLSRDPIKVKTNSLSLLKALIIKPPYIALLPHHFVAEDIRANTLRTLKPAGQTLRRKGGLIYRKNRLENPILKALFGQIRAACEAAKPL